MTASAEGAVLSFQEEAEGEGIRGREEQEQEQEQEEGSVDCQDQANHPQIHSADTEEVILFENISLDLKANPVNERLNGNSCDFFGLFVCLSVFLYQLKSFLLGVFHSQKKGKKRKKKGPDYFIFILHFTSYILHLHFLPPPPLPLTCYCKITMTLINLFFFLFLTVSRFRKIHFLAVSTTLTIDNESVQEEIQRLRALEIEIEIEGEMDLLGVSKKAKQVLPQLVSLFMNMTMDPRAM